VTSDVVPYAMVIGHRGGIVGVNVRGLSRRGFDRATIQKLRAAYAVFFSTEGRRADRIAALESQFGDVPAVTLLVEFLRSAGERPLTLPRKAGIRDDDEA
jgi:UDP-N-acetylglucosamine acyltransferase